MKVGDLVRYYNKNNPSEWDWMHGIVTKQIPGTDEVQIIRWTDGSFGSYPKRKLKVLSEK